MAVPGIYPGVVSRLFAGVDSGKLQNLPLTPRIYPRGSFWELEFTLGEILKTPAIYPCEIPVVPRIYSIIVRVKSNIFDKGLIKLDLKARGG